MSGSASARSRSTSASGAAHVFVKMVVKGSETPTRKLLKPTSLAQLVRQCNQLFKPEKPIQSFKTEDGVPVDNIGDVPVGAILIASTRPMRKKDDSAAHGLSFKEIENMNFLGAPPTMSGGMSTISGQGPASDRASVRSGKASQMSGGFSCQKSVSFAVGDQSGHIPMVRSRMSDMASVSRGRSVTSSKMDSSVFDESQMGRSTMSRMRPTSAPPTGIKALMNTLIPQDKSLPYLDNYISKSDKKEFLTSLIPTEDAQSHAWYSAVLRQPVIAHLCKNINVYEEIKKYAETFVEDHRFLSGKWVDHRMKMAVIGPRKSGKSILLGELTNQVLVEMVYTGEWKSTLVFSFDVLQILRLLNNYEALLGFFVDSTVDAMLAQRPYLRHVTKDLKHKLKSITEMRAYVPKLSEKTVFDEIAIQLSDLWRDKDAIVPFFTSLFYLPIELAKASGFENVLMVVDNFDCGDVQVVPRAPFTANQNYLFIIEFMKFALDNANFIIACKDCERFFQVMGPTDELGVDLMQGIDFVSTMDVVEVEEDDLVAKYMVHLEGETMGLQLNVLLCGGVVHYLRLWDKLRRLVENLEGQPEQYDDNLFHAINAAQELVDLLFYTDDNKEELRVASIVSVPEVYS